MAELKELVPYTCKMSLLYMDTDKELLNGITTVLKKVFSRVDDAEDEDIALSYVKVNSYDLIIIDASSDVSTTKQLISNIKSLNKYQHIIVSTKETTFEDDLDIYSVGVDCVIRKPFAASSMLSKILYVTSKLSNDRNYLQNDMKKLNDDLLYERKRIGRFMMNEKKLKEQIQSYENKMV